MVPVLRSDRYRRALIVLIAILAVFAAGGCVWGIFIPTTTATVDSGYLSTDPTQDGREFTGFVALVAGLFVLSMGSALAAWGWAPRSRGPLMIWLLAIVAVLGGNYFYRGWKRCRVQLAPTSGCRRCPFRPNHYVGPSHHSRSGPCRSTIIGVIDILVRSRRREERLS